MLPIGCQQAVDFVICTGIIIPPLSSSTGMYSIPQPGLPPTDHSQRALLAESW